ncbi:MAG: Fpg/Nei family DNA glycosylase [Chloroflexi bacterium]|nr:Fpg/Nei family DNA glycosylase [Chloroflexota bacterium]
MPEGDTLFRTAAVLREVLAGRPVTAARGRPDGVALGRVVGSRVGRVEAAGKHLLISFSNGLSLHTHLRMNGSWHRYRTGEAWRRTPARAVAVVEVPGAVAVCFDAPTVELLDSRALAIHPALAALGPDLLAPESDLAEALRRIGSTSRREMPLGEALLDQTVVAGLGNVYRSEICFIERVDPFQPVGRLAAATLTRVVATAQRLISANRNDPARTTTMDATGAPPGPWRLRRPGDRLYVYGRTGRPCRRCGTPICSTVTGALPRRTYWCPTCQPAGAGARAGASAPG